MAAPKGTELNNVQETWNQNEKLNSDESNAGVSSSDSDIDQQIREEASEYDRSNKIERTLDGERASVNDDSMGQATEENE